jgi:hypothetical protein
MKALAINLLKPLVDGVAPEAESVIRMHGYRWALSTEQDMQAEEFVCVSYAWGSGTTDNAFFPGIQLMSDRLMRVLEIAMDASRQRAGKFVPIWIDALCLPPVFHPERKQALERMGEVFIHAAEVVVVLSPQSKAFLGLAHDRLNGELNDDTVTALLELDSDIWVSRAWTYQEAVNNTCLSFVAEGDPLLTIVAPMELLNALGYAISKYRLPNRFDTWPVFRARHPHLWLLEDLLGDWMMSRTWDRSALQIMSEMDRRVRAREEDYFNAMLAAVNTMTTDKVAEVDGTVLMENDEVQELRRSLKFKEGLQQWKGKDVLDDLISPVLMNLLNSGPRPSRRSIKRRIGESGRPFWGLLEKRNGNADPEEIQNMVVIPFLVAHAAERFIQLCEAKGDFSFIYSSGPRSQLPGKHWRPVSNVLASILPHHSWGESQPGTAGPSELQLHDMVLLTSGHLDASAIRWFTDLSRMMSMQSATTAIDRETVLEYIRGFDFRGVGDAIQLTSGYFYPSSRWDAEMKVEVFISSVLRWSFGSPGMLVSRCDEEGSQYRFHSVGVFIGDFTLRLQGEKRSIRIAE